MHWCLRRLICAACGSHAACLIWHAVALELSIIFASWCTWLAGNLSKSTLLPLIVLDTNSSSGRKNQKISLCKILAVSGGYIARLSCASKVLYYSSTFLLPCLKLVRRSKWAHTSFDWGLQNSSNFVQIVSKVNSSDGKLHETYWSMPKFPLQAITFLHCCCSGKDASSHSRIFSHFKCHLKTYGKAQH